MSVIDPRTVILLTGLMSVLMSLVLYSLKRNYPASIKGLREWAFGLLVIFVGSLLFAGRGQLPDLVTIPISNFLVWLGLYLTYVGSQRFFGIAPRVGPWLALLTAGLLLLTWFTLVEPVYHVRLILGTGLRALLFGVHAALIWRQRSITFAKALAIGVLALMTTVQVLRAVTSFYYPLGTDIFNTEPRQQIYITSYALFVLLFSISLVLMATDRLRTELEHLASHDSLTQTLTRRHMNQACEQELQRCQRHDRSMALLLLDLDQFKAVNDSYGHQAGDRVLVNFVTKVGTLLRQADQFGRFGGEEFVALLPETSLAEAIVVADRIRAACSGIDQEPSCTVSIGVTVNRPDSDSVDAMMARADAAMYRAKANGRDRLETG